MYGCMDVCMYRCIEVWMYGRKNVWIFSYMDVRKYGYIYFFIIFVLGIAIFATQFIRNIFGFLSLNLKKYDIK